MTKRASAARKRPVSRKPRRASFHWTPAHTRWTLGVVCLTLAALTIVGLVAPTQNTPTDWWVGLVGRVVGWGAWLVPVGLSVLGVWIIQRGARRPWKIAPAHVWGPVFLFLVGLALTHLLVGNPLAARDAGRGGGAIG
ncbi:MAG: hypothetical protein GX557_08705, partial [Chloroflexi bacterium]|nr:hypothetical protein [Chloroflexota bacterium]